MRLRFHGVRGSTPCSGPNLARYGGSTSCVVFERPGCRPIVFDLGSGLRMWNWAPTAGEDFAATALVTHLHWDHIQGLPFFPPVLQPGALLDIIAPRDEFGGADANIRAALSPPTFPVALDSLLGTITINDAPDGAFAVDDAAILCRPVPHVGATVGYRVARGGATVAYIPDHQQPGSHATEVHRSVLELARDVDVLIHDAQYDEEEFRQRSDWGHSTVRYAVEVAAQARARCLVLFHHDPSHSDDEIDALTVFARECARGSSVQSVVAAAEGAVLNFQIPGARNRNSRTKGSTGASAGTDYVTQFQAAAQPVARARL